MINSKITIEIVRSTETGLSSISQRSAAGIYEVLNKHYTDVKITIINNLADLEAVIDRRPDLVFLGVKSIPLHYELGFADPEMIWVSDYLEENGIIYTGSDRVAHELESNKALSKQKVISAGLRTSPFFVIDRKQTENKLIYPFSFPVFIKPTSRGGGLGIDSQSLAQDHNQLWAKVTSLVEKYNSDSLIEEHLPGREYSVAILKKLDEPGHFIMPIELVAPKDENGQRILSGKVKKADAETRYLINDQKLKTAISELAMNVFLLIGARDFGRIDIRLDKYDQPNFLEANLMPSLIEDYGSFPRACSLILDMDHESMILNIVNLALARKVEEYQNLHEDIVINNIFEPFPVI